MDLPDGAGRGGQVMTHAKVVDGMCFSSHCVYRSNIATVRTVRMACVP